MATIQQTPRPPVRVFHPKCHLYRRCDDLPVHPRSDDWLGWIGSTFTADPVVRNPRFTGQYEWNNNWFTGFFVNQSGWWQGLGCSDPGNYPYTYSTHGWQDGIFHYVSAWFPGDPLVEGQTNANPSGGSDRHVHTILKGQGVGCEVWYYNRTFNNVVQASNWDLNSLTPPKTIAGHPAGGTAHKGPFLGMPLWYEELERGIAHHQLFAVVHDAKQNEWLWPARRTDGSATHVDAVPYGAVVRLKSSVDINTRVDDRYPSATAQQKRWVKAWLRTLRTYGAVVGDRNWVNDFDLCHFWVDSRFTTSAGFPTPAQPLLTLNDLEFVNFELVKVHDGSMEARF